MTWPWVVAALGVVAVVSFTAGVVLMGRLLSASRAVELDHIFLSKSVGR